MAAIVWWQYQKVLLNGCAKINCSKVFIGVLYLLKKPGNACHSFLKDNLHLNGSVQIKLCFPCRVWFADGCGGAPLFQVLRLKPEAIECSLATVEQHG